jgi:pimeloyl-ACP methyl ester carboxylesterase
VVELFHRLVSLEWRRHGARLRELPIAGCRVWYADFAPQRPGAPPASPSRGAATAGEGAGRSRPRPPTLVLLHGLGASATSFHPVIQHLRRGYRVVVPDLPGCGASRPPRGREFLPFAELVEVAERFVARVAPAGAYLAGNSMGGWIAAKIAARRPELVRGMALLNPGGPALRAEDWVDFCRILTAEETGVVDEWLRRVFHRPPLLVRLLSRDFQRTVRGPSVAQLMTHLQEEDFLSPQEARRVRCAAVLVWGERDRLIPDGCRSFYLKRLKGVRYEPVPDCGHCPQLECPGRTARILLELPALAARRDARRRAAGAHRAGHGVAIAAPVPRRSPPAGERRGTEPPAPGRHAGLAVAARAPKA